MQPVLFRVSFNWSEIWTCQFICWGRVRVVECLGFVNGGPIVLDCARMGDKKRISDKDMRRDHICVWD